MAKNPAIGKKQITSTETKQPESKKDALIQELKRLKSLNDHILSAVGEGIYGLDLKGRVVFINPSATRLLGYTQSELKGKVMHQLTHHTKKDGTHYRRHDCPIYSAFTKGETYTNNDELFFRKDGTVIPVEYTSTPMYDGKKLIGAVVSFSDISRRKITENDLQTLNTDLERSNRELQDFASVASHDLQEPLRKIQAFSDRLMRKYRSDLPKEAQDYLDRMSNAANRMQTLINDLLTFSRVTTKAQPFNKINLSTIVEEVLSDLEIAVEDAKAHIYLEPLPSLYADPLQMRQLFQNLIGNALKFHPKNNPPSISITTSPSEKNGGRKYVTVEIQDNGIGFDEKYIDRIFNVFQRLHTSNEFTGNGVGLAVCRKIVERHEGTLTAKSSPGKGARFIITLPLKQTLLTHTLARHHAATTLQLGNTITHAL